MPAALAHRLWAKADWPRARPLAGRCRCRARHQLCRAAFEAARGWCRSTTVGSCATPTTRSRRSRARGKCCAAQSPAGAVVHTSSHASAAGSTRAVAGHARLSPSTSARSRWHPHQSVPRSATSQAQPFVLAVGKLERRKNLPDTGASVRRARGASSPTCTSCLPGPTATIAPAIDAAVDALGAASKRVVVHRPGRRRRALVVVASRQRARLPVAR